MRRAAVVIACLACACGFTIPAGSASGTDDGGTGSDGSTVSGDAMTFGCYGTGMVRVCLLAPPPPSFIVTTPQRIDTGVTGNCTPVSGTNVTGTCVIVAEEVAIMQDIRAVGTRPLIIVATTTFTVTGKIDAASRGDGVGAGASTTVCTGGDGPSANALGSGGGAGGSFTGAGGSGGYSAGGAPGPTLITPSSVRGGCRGQGGADVTGSGGDGGAGGGVIYLIAGGAMQITGILNASGRGGEGANPEITGAGGGGGGSGGMIVLDAPMVDISGQVFASGGGGGGGSDNFFGGSSGGDPVGPGSAPGGGNGGAGGGKGGGGTAGASLDGETGGGTTGVAGGGGGGGGAGFIQVLGTRSGGGVFSPSPS